MSALESARECNRQGPKRTASGSCVNREFLVPGAFWAFVRHRCRVARPHPAKQLTLLACSLFGSCRATYAACMLRRLARLAIVLLSLTGTVPAALACAVAALATDCCPAGGHCGTSDRPAMLVTSTESCCDLGPTQQQTAVTAARSTEK